MEQYYKPSGKVHFSAYLYYILAALVALPILAVIYAYAIWYIPFPYINFIITGAFGAAIGIAISLVVVKLGKVRSGTWAFIFCLCGALTALYIHWAVWVDLVFNISGSFGSEDLGVATSNMNFSEVMSLLSQPVTLFGLMSEINEVGVWGISGGAVSGGFLTFIWIVEIVLAVFVALSFGTAQASKPFCENENKWFDETETPPKAVFLDGPSLVKAMSLGDMTALGTMLQPAGDVTSQHHAIVTLYDAASGENYISVMNRIAKTDDKGSVSFDDQEVVSFLKANQEVVDMFKV